MKFIRTAMAHKWNSLRAAVDNLVRSIAWNAESRSIVLQGNTPFAEEYMISQQHQWHNAASRDAR